MHTNRRVMSVAVLTASIFVAQTTRAAGSAKEILDAAGVRGGLVVHVGCGDGSLTANLRANENLVVQGLDTDAANVERARTILQTRGLHGPVSVAQFDGKRLPYIDNLVNLIVVASGKWQVASEEFMRVLAPGGVLLHSDPQSAIRNPKSVKPVPAGYDEWTHYLRAADNNAASRDAVAGPPRTIQWMAGPIWSRHHDKQASISAVVTSKGRVFYIVDRGPAHTPDHPPQWFVEARDAYNGLLLWSQPMKSWVSHMRRFRSGPVQLARLLVTDGDRVFVTMGINEPVSVLEPSTGEETRTLAGTAKAEEIILHEGALLTVVGEGSAEHAYEPKVDFKKKAIVAANPDDGQTLWRWPAEGSANIVPQTLAAAGTRVLLQDGVDTVCLAMADGAETWRTPTFPAPKAEPKPAKEPVKGKKKRKSGGKRSAGWCYATLVVHDDVVLSCDGAKMWALSASSGEKMWSCDAKTPFGKTPSVDILVVNDVVWTSPNLDQGRDLRTGEIVKSLDVKQTVVTAGHHHRCYRNKAIGDHIVFGWRGMEFFDTKGEAHWRHNWVRGLCQYGVMPANGLVYAPPHNCGCYPEALLHGFFALGPARPAPPASELPRLMPGPAHGTHQSTPTTPGGWPIHRGDMSRSGCVEAALPAELTPAWEADVGADLTAPVIAGGTVVVARKDNYAVIALDEKTGKTRWTFAPGGLVDSPPTVHAGGVLFGSTDGYVYRVALADGKLVWRFRAGPSNASVVSMGRVENLWPVHGSVLVKNGVAYFAAGRSSYLDGGILLLGIDAVTGAVKYEGRVNSEQAGRLENKTGKQTTSIAQNKMDYKTDDASDKSDAFSMEGNTSDILSADADSVYLRHMRFGDDLARKSELVHHLFSTSSLLDDNEAHRSHWFYGNGDFSRLTVAYEWLTRGSYGGFQAPFARLAVFDSDTLWGVYGHGMKYDLFAFDIRNIDERMQKDFPAVKGKKKPETLWMNALPVHPRAMVKAGASIYIAGAEKTAQLLEPGDVGGVLLIAAAGDGKETGRLSLTAPPVFDGMASTGGKLFVSQTNGKLVCLAGK